jgi:hypothetical protein
MKGFTSLLFVTVLVSMVGCGSSERMPSTSGDGVARKVRAAWTKEPSCRRPRGASRWGCSVGSYHCQGVVADRGSSITCSKPGAAVFFKVQPG